MKVHVLSRHQAINWLRNEDFFDRFNLISINDSVELMDELNLTPPEGSCLSLVFDDCSERLPIFTMSGTYYTEPMSEETGREIIKFLDNMDKSKDLVVHCTAGICRSGAVGMFVVKYLGLDYDCFMKKHPQICPNQHVYKTLWSQNS